MDQSRARGRDQFLARVRGPHGLAAHQPGSGGRGQRNQPVGALHRAGKPGQGRGRNPAHAQLLQAPAGPGDVHQGVDGPHLMKVHLFRRNLMRLGLGQGQGLQHGQGPLPRRAAHIQDGEDGRDVRRMAQGLDLVPAHVHPPAGAADARLGPGLNAAIHTGAGQDRRQRGNIQPQMDQGGQGHVAADAVAAIQI